MNAQSLKDAVLELRTLGKTVVFSTHVMDNAERMCDAVCIIARGTKVLDGTIAQLREQHAARYVLITCEAPQRALELLRPPLCRQAQQHGGDVTAELDGSARPEHVLEALVNGGARVTRFEPMQPSLHQIFVETVGAAGVEEGVSGHG
jgi:ABC-2 type transport system ATP-binding protein